VVKLVVCTATEVPPEVEFVVLLNHSYLLIVPLPGAAVTDNAVEGLL
jgi:hypothetical protein